MNTSFFGDLLQTISDRGRFLLERGRRSRGNGGAAGSQDLAELCEELLSGRGEASGVALAREILTRYAELTTGPRIAFFEALAHRFGADPGRLKAAVVAWEQAPSDSTALKLHAAAEPRRQELFRRLNLAPGGTAALVKMREQLVGVLDHRDDLAAVDEDFVHLFSSWFNRGFLVLQRIDWSTPAIVLEKIIRYEAVHAIRDWDDLRKRIDSPDRCCYAFFHPALVDDPLIFVEVALTRDIPAAIAPVLDGKRELLDPARANTAVFYSISNCQRGLTGVSFGHFLIKQVVEEITREFPRLSTFVTLSPAPNFGQWLARELKNDASQALSAEDKSALALLDDTDWWHTAGKTEAVSGPLMRAAASYFLRAKTGQGAPLDSVARFHLGNGARLERLNFLADTSDKALAQSYGLMVNYLYDLDDIEKNHEAYAENRTVAAANAVKRMLPAPQRDLAAIPA